MIDRRNKISPSRTPTQQNRRDRKQLLAFLPRLFAGVSICVTSLYVLRSNSFRLVGINDVIHESISISAETVLIKTGIISSSPIITRISLLGERNSGTRWTSSHLKECFSGVAVVVDDDDDDTTAAPRARVVKVEHRLVRHKHWFQHDVLPELRVDRTLVIAQFRDPIYWVDAMRRRPHHAPMHYQKDWSDFVQIPWTLPARPLLDSKFIIQQQRIHNKSTGNNICHEFFEPHQLIACVKYPFPTREEYEKYVIKEIKSNVVPSYSGTLPRYELRDYDGSAYNNILEMRTDKIRNFLAIKDWDWIEDVHVVQYEQLVSQGTESLIAYIEGITGLTANCTAVPPQQDARPPKTLDPAYVQWMNNHVDWEVEKLIGYIPHSIGTSSKDKTKKLLNHRLI